MYSKGTRVEIFGGVEFSFFIAMVFLSIGLNSVFALDNHSTSWISRDKIRMGWGPSISQYKAVSKAGMNAVMPRVELDAVLEYNPAEAERPLSKHDARIIRQLQSGSREAKLPGLRYVHCLDLASQFQTVKVGFENNPARYNNGNLPSPVDPVYWRRAILQRVQRVLDLLDDTNVYALDGVIIDPEMYTLSGAVPGDPDYGRYAFETFLKETNRPVPPDVVTVQASRKWLKSHHLDKEFVRWQFDRIVSMAGELRQLVRSRRPNAILGFIIYKNKLWFNAMARGLSAKNRPVFIGPESTYSGVMDKSFIQYIRGIRTSVGVPCSVVPGVRMGMENGNLLWQDFIAPNTSKIFRIPERLGKMCVVVISAGMNAYRIRHFNCPVMLIGSNGVTLNSQGQGRRFFFFVPPGKTNFSLRIQGNPIETADYILHDPTGKIVGRWDKLTKSTTEKIKVTTPGIWYSEATGLVDNAGFKLANLPNFFALQPEDLRSATNN